jgi:hypothetical protein
MNEKNTIVPVALSDSQSPYKSPRNPNQNNPLACRLKIKDLEINIYNHADSSIVKACLAEVSKYSR